MTNSTSTITRLFELYRKIPSMHGAGVSTKKLHQYLLEEGFTVSKRTVERDLLKLHEITGIYSEATEEGNFWRNSASNLDLLPTMQPTEALLLVAAERLLRHAMPPESIPLLEQRLSKAKKTLDKSNRLAKWEDKLHIIEGQVPHTSKPLDAAILRVVYESVLDETKLTLRYQKLDAEQASHYLLNPLAIIVREHAHYLIATKSESPDKPQLFNLSRIEYAELKPNTMVRPKGFNLADYIASNPTGWLQDKSVHIIEMRVRWFAYDWLCFNQLHPSQTLTKIDEEWYRLTLNNHITYDLVGWVLRFSTDVIVESPELMVDEVKERLTHMIEAYKK
ncbi:helix-turn-helix transcriptional regulator [Vibrio kanaloae]|uniref:WYL domain-containing protein n=1 Tax=Vibrio kanaloae TaxID=170673 RepID=A0A4U1ZEZ9_9VIBR|nr:WYL domain-containing protein [Vibrio kanaloae]TKF32632.1 WYL domain-containing protein [Vibrio kanaloae]